MQNIYWGLSKTVARMADLQDKPTLLHEAATAAWVRRFQFQSLERAAAVAAVEDAPRARSTGREDDRVTQVEVAARVG